MESIWIGLGIAIAGYKTLIDSLNEDDEHELIKENDVHHFMGISKEDAKSLIDEYPGIPHIIINDKVYYPKEKLRKWLLNLGD